METIPTHIRKAAVLLRSLDSATSAQLLAQLSSEEVTLVRTAVRSLRDVDDEERADVLAELRLAGVAPKNSVATNGDSGVEIADSLLSLSQADVTSSYTSSYPSDETTDNLAFSLISDAAPQELAPYLGLQHAQTVAVIFSHLDAGRAASLLAELPRNLQADVVQRLSDLGTTDEESLKIIQDDLAEWLSQQQNFVSKAERGDHAARILAATKPNVRDGLLSQLGQRNGQLAELLKRSLPAEPTSVRKPVSEPVREKSVSKKSQPVANVSNAETARNLFPSTDIRPQQTVSLRTTSRAKPMRPTIPFERLAELDIATLEAVLRSADPAMVRLAMVGADEALVKKVVGLLPKAVAKQFQRQLHQMGPTRLSDVAFAQQTLAESAGNFLANAALEQRTQTRTHTTQQPVAAYA